MSDISERWKCGAGTRAMRIWTVDFRKTNEAVVQRMVRACFGAKGGAV
jgi:hypothetical protein